VIGRNLSWRQAVFPLREQKSWSQEHLASASGLSVRTVQRVEIESVASAERRLSLAAALDVPVADLMSPSPSARATVDDGPLPPLVANSRFHAVGATFMRKTLLALGVGIAFAFAVLVLLNALSGFLR
jgi:hypothetical protein